MAAVQITNAVMTSAIAARCGPYQDGSGNLWVVAKGALDQNIYAYKSSDGGSTWSTSYTVATGSFVNFVDSVFDSVNGIIYVLDASGTPNLRIYSFTISNTTWAEVYSSGSRPTPALDANNNYPSFLTRRSTGEFVVVYQGPTHNSMGSNYRSVYYARCSSAGVWSAGVEVDAGGAIHFDCKGAVLGASDRVHMLYHDLIASDVLHRSLDSSNAFSPSSGGDVIPTGGYGISTNYYTIYYHSTLNQVVVGIVNTGTGYTKVVRGASSTTPNWSADGTNVGTAVISSSNVAFIYDTSGAKLYAFYRADNNTLYQNSASGTTWGTAAQFETTTPVAISISGITNGIGVIYSQTSSPIGVYFDKLTLVTGTEYTDTATVSGVTTPSGTEFKAHDYTEAATVASTTAPSATEIAQYTETATTASVTAITSDEIYTPGTVGTEYTDQATVSGTTTPSTDELVNYVETATIGGYSHTEEANYYNDFSSGLDNKLLWQDWTDPVSVINGELIIKALGSGNRDCQVTYGSQDYSTLDLEGMTCITKLNSFATTATDATYNKTMFRVLYGSGLDYLCDGKLVALFKQSDGSFRSDQFVIISPPFWMRIRISSGIIYLDYSINGINWTTLDSGPLVLDNNYSNSRGSSFSFDAWSDYTHDVEAHYDYFQLDTLYNPEITIYTDQVTISGTTIPSSEELVEYTESATVAGTTIVSATEVYAPVKETTTYRTRLTALSDPETVDPENLYIRARKANVGDSGILRVWLYEGATLREGPYDITLTNSFATNNRTLANAANITSWSDIEIVIQGISDAGYDLTPQVSWINFTIPAAAPSGVEYTDASTIGGATAVSATEVADYIESETVAGATDITSLELVETIESETIAGTTEPSATEIYEVIESATVAGVTDISAVEAADYVDATTATGATNIDSVEAHETPDVATVTGTTEPSSTDVADYVDSSTTAGSTLVTSDEVYTPYGGTEYVDAAIASSVTEPSAEEIAAYVDQAEIPGTTTIETTDIAEYIDGTTTTSVTEVSAVELIEVVEVVEEATVTGATSVEATEIADYVDQAETASVTTIGAFEEYLREYLDSATVSSTTSTPLATLLLDESGNVILDENGYPLWDEFGTVEVAYYVDSTTIAGTTSLTSDEVYTPYGGVEYTDQAEVAGTTTLAAEDIADYIDGLTTPGVTSISATELEEYVEQETAAGVTSITAIEVAEYVETATADSATSLESTETHEIPDTETVPGTTSVESTDVAEYVDQETTASVTSITSDEIYQAYAGTEYIDLATVPSVTTIESVEEREIVDADTVVGATAIDSIDVAEFIETATVASSTELSYGESVAVLDSSEIDSNTGITSIDLADYIDGSTASSATQVVDSIELLETTETETVASATSIESVDVADYLDAATTTSITEVFSEEVVTGVKVTTIYRTQLTALGSPTPLDPEDLYIRARKANPADSGVLRVWLYEGNTLREGPYDIILTDSFTTDDHTLVNSANITDWSNIEVAIQGISDTGTELTPQVSWINFVIPPLVTYEYTDTATISGSSSVSSVDVADFIDGTEIPSATAVLPLEEYAAEDASIVASATEPSGVDVADYVDGSEIDGVTSIEYIEGQTNVYVDTDVIASSTTLDSTDIFAGLDASSISSVTYISATETTDFIEATLVGCNTTPTSVDISDFLDADIVASVTSLGTLDIHGTGKEDSETIPGITEVTYVEVAAYVDANIASGVTTASYVETADYLDSATIPVNTVITSEELYAATFFDEATISSVTTLTSEEYTHVTIFILEGYARARWLDEFEVRWSVNTVSKWAAEKDLRWQTNEERAKWRSEWIH